MFFSKKKKVKAIDVTTQNFNDIITQENTAILFDFWASWCGPCKVLGPFVNELAADFEDRAIVAKINIDQNPEISAQFNIKSVPTLLFIKDRRIVERVSGLVPKPNLAEMLEDLIAYEYTPPSSDEEE